MERRMELIEKILSEIKEDKADNFSTTSFKFKRDLWTFFQDFQDKVIVEFGTHKGQTTRILSYLFKKVYTVNLNDNKVAIELNRDRSNIEYINNFNLYDHRIPLPVEEPVDVFFIDAGHEYEHIILDINRATSMKRAPECFIIFDDYGLARWQHSVGKGVNEAIQMGLLEHVVDIGHEKGYVFSDTNQRHLVASEGIITRYI